MDYSLLFYGAVQDSHRRVVRSVAFLLIFVAALCVDAALSFSSPLIPANAIHLTDKEHLWLKQHPVIRIGVDADFPPYEFVDQYNRHAGVSSDYLKALSEVLGVQFERVKGLGWSEILQRARDREIDLIPLVTNSPPRAKYLAFTAPYIRYQIAIVSPQGVGAPQSLGNLAGKKVALVKNYFASKRIREHQPDIQAYDVDAVIDALKAVAEGKAEAMVADAGTVSFMIRQYGLSTLHISGFADISVPGFSMGVRSDWPELVTILDKALMALPFERQQQILQRWIEGSHDEDVAIALSQREKAFIQQHPLIRLGIDPEFAPFEYLEEGRYSGMASDYIELLNRRLGLNMQVVKGVSWSEAVEGVKSGKIDLLPTVGMTEARKEFLNYTKPHIHFHRVIITRTDMPFITGIDDVVSLKVAVQANSSHAGYIKDYTKVTPIAFPTLSESLLALSNGEVDAFVGNIASSTYWIRKMNLTNLKVAAPVSQEIQALHFAVRKDWPELVTILQKGLDTISDKQQRKISEKWLLLEYAPTIDYKLIGEITIGFTLMLMLISLWNIQIRRQKKALQRAEAIAVTANAELTRMHGALEELVEVRTAELKESEKNFRQAQKMEALGTLVGGIAHDFNNILAGMLGSIYLAKSSSADTEIVEKSLANADELGFRAADMIKQLLTFAREEEVSKKTLAFVPFFKEANKLVASGLEESIRFSTRVKNDALYVCANSTQLQQLLFNLINNARDALLESKKPEISVTLSHFEADGDFSAQHPETSHEQFALIEVQDNGEGIPEENLTQLFDPFFTTKEVGKGTGLGLAMVYGTVKEHGGVLEVESRVGKGSCFKVYLPLEEGMVSQVESEDGDIHHGAGETILLVDDDLQLQSTNKAILMNLGYQLLVANDGREAVQLFAANPGKIDLVIMDVVMPVMSGPMAVKKIRQLNRKVKIVYLTGYDSKGALTAQLDRSKEVVLNKPCPISYLSRVIREQLEMP